MKKAELKQRTEKQRDQRNNELEIKAKNGDPEARMSLAKPNSKEYWEAYQESEIVQCNSYDNKVIRLINEISIFEEDFAVRVLKSIEVEGEIYGRLISQQHK